MAATALPIACYVMIRVSAHSFSGPSPSVRTISLLATSWSATVLIQHFARCIDPLLSVAGLLIGVGLWMRRQQRAGRTAITGEAGAASYACLGSGAALVLQPAVLNPAWASCSETRLAVLGLTLLIVALGVMFGQLGRVRSLSRGLVGALLGLLAMGSLHHTYSRIRGSNEWETLALEAFVAVAMVAVLYYFRELGGLDWPRPGWSRPASSR